MSKPRRVATMVGVCTALLQAVACSDEPEIASAPCEVTAVERPVVEVVVIDSDAEPICDIVLREVARLGGRLDGTLARRPVALVPDGRYLTATYQPGEVAVWSPTGDLEMVLGRGPGEGPGEFGGISNLLVDGTGIVWVLAQGKGHRYKLDGEYVGFLRLPPGAGQVGAGLTDDRVVLTGITREGWVQLTIAGPDGFEEFGPPTVSPGVYVQLMAAGPDVWSTEDMYYEVRHHDLDTGEIDFRVRREADWFPEPSRQRIETGVNLAEPRGSLAQFTVDPRGLIWTRPAHVGANPQARGAGERPVDRENRPPIDRRLEVFTPDGRLVASKLLDPEDPLIRAIGGNRWYFREDDDLQTIVIVEPVLVARGSDRSSGS